MKYAPLSLSLAVMSGCLPLPVVVDDSGDDTACAAFVTLFRDEDGDGHGDASRDIERCEGQSEQGYVAVADDCDDQDPSAWELFEGWPDADGDGYGAPGAPVQRCGDDGSLAEVDGDCEDDDASVFPGAEPVCDDGLDNDCDGLGDCPPPEVGARFDQRQADAVILGETGQDVGGALLGLGDATGDGLADVVVGATMDDAPVPAPGEAWIFAGPLSGELGRADAVAILRGAVSNDLAGGALSSGDLNNDGVLDLIIGAVNGGGLTQGGAYVAFGPVTGAVNLGTGDSLLLASPYTGDLGGSAVLGGADWLGGDGQGDIIIGSRHATLGGSMVGAAFVMAGPLSTSTTLDKAELILLPDDAGSEFGSSLANAGDLDGDGIAEFVVGAPNQNYTGDSSTERRGAICLYAGGMVGNHNAIDDAMTVVYGTSANGALGAVVSAAGDLDNDGIDDLLVGNPKASVSGAIGNGVAYALSGAALAAREASGPVDAAINLGSVFGEQNGDAAGSSVAALDDLDGDGYREILVGAPNVTTDVIDAGGVYLWYGPLSGADVTAHAPVWIESAGDSALLGSSVGAAGDMNGLGRSDLMFGGTGVIGEVEGAGAVWFLAMDRL